MIAENAIKNLEGATYNVSEAFQDAVYQAFMMLREEMLERTSASPDAPPFATERHLPSQHAGYAWLRDKPSRFEFTLGKMFRLAEGYALIHRHDVHSFKEGVRVYVVEHMGRL